MKRSDALIPLSHDHHHALFVAKLLRDSGEGPGSKDEALAAFRSFWQVEGREHFRIEEEILLPLSGLEGPATDPDVARMLNDHLQIRRMAREVLTETPDSARFKNLGERLASHVRFEERELFPRIERQLGPSGLVDLEGAIVAALAEYGTDG